MARPVTILIADDDAGHARLIEKNLQRGGFAHGVLRFQNGQEILNFLFQRDSSSILVPNGSYLLLLDIRMPKVDGIEVLKQIKADPKIRRLPVLMLTTTDDPVEIARCHSLGCNNYIVKPVDYDQFSNAIQQLASFVGLLQVPPISANTP